MATKQRRGGTKVAAVNTTNQGSVRITRLAEAGSDEAALAQRLEDGYRRIDQAQGVGQDTEAWEAFWIDLLHQYEALCDRLDLAA